MSIGLRIYRSVQAAMSKCWLILFVNIIVAVPVAQRRPPNPDCQSDREMEYIKALRSSEVQESDPEFFVESIICTGKLRSIAAVNALADLLDYKYEFPWDHGGEFYLVSRTERYPAAGALVEIGKPALPSLTVALGSRDMASDPARTIVVAMLLIFDGNLENTASYLRKASLGADSDDERQRLLNGISYLEHLKSLRRD